MNELRGRLNRSNENIWKGREKQKENVLKRSKYDIIKDE